MWIFCLYMYQIIMKGTWITFILIELKSNRDQSKRSLDHTSKKKEYVNSPVVSLTTQNDFGLLVPPLNISFGHIKVRRHIDFSTNNMHWFIPLIIHSELLLIPKRCMRIQYPTDTALTETFNLLYYNVHVSL